EDARRVPRRGRPRPQVARMSTPDQPSPAASGGYRRSRREHHNTGHHQVQSGHAPVPHNGKELAWLSLGALGVVYGDIGTSPLYAMRECLTASNEHVTVAPETANVLGVLSLFFWALLL